MMQTEKQSLRAQLESVQREHAFSDEENSRLALRAHELEKENAALRGRAEEAMHRGKLEASNVRVEMLRERGDIERDRDRLHSQLQGTQHCRTDSHFIMRKNEAHAHFWFLIVLLTPTAAIWVRL